MTASPLFTINSTQAPAAVATTYGATVSLALVSTTGVNTIQWSLPGASRSLTTPTIAVSGTPAGATASFAMVADDGSERGAAFVVKCQITDANGISYTAYGIVGVVDGTGTVPFVLGEELARDAVFGWCPTLNQKLLSFYSSIPIPPTGSEGSLFYVDSSNDLAYTDELVTDGTYIGFGLGPASMGEVRFSSAWSVVSKDGVSGLNQTHFASDGVTLFIGTQSSYPVKYASGTSHSFYTGGSAQVIIDTAGVSAQFVPLKVLGVGSYLAVDNYLSIGTGTLPSTGLLRLPDGGKIVHHDGTGNRDTIATDGTSVLVNDGLSVNTERVNAAILPLRIAEVWEYAPADSPKVKSRTLYAAATLTGEDAEVITLATTGGTAYAVPSGFLARIILEIYARDTSTGDAYLSLTTITGKRESGGVFVARGTPDPDANLDPDVPVTNGCTASVAFTSSNIVVTVESSSGTVEWTVVATIQETVL